MSTTYNTTKDAKDKESTETYTRNTDGTSDTTKTSMTGKNKTTGSNVTGGDSDKTHTFESSESSQYGKVGSGTSSGMQQSRGQQFEMDQHSGRQQAEIQAKLKEVGALLQKAGHLLQDLQGAEFQCASSWSRGGPGGNYNGPYGGFESHQQYGQPSPYGPSGSQWGHPSGSSSRFESERMPPSGGRWTSEDREDRVYGSGRTFSSRPEERNFESSRQSTDRYGGFGGPNRPDLAYGEQYGAHVSFGSEGRRGGDFEGARRGGNNFSRW